MKDVAGLVSEVLPCVHEAVQSDGQQRIGEIAEGVVEELAMQLLYTCILAVPPLEHFLWSSL